MAVTIVQLKPRPRGRVLVELSGGRFFTIPQEEAVGLHPGDRLSPAQVAQLSEIDQWMRGRDRALSLLARRARTEREVQEALAVMGLAPKVCARVVGELRQAGFLDDAKFTREYVRTRVEGKGLGPHRLRYELRRLGVAEELIEEAIEARFSGEAQEELAFELARRKLGQGPADERAVRRVADMLERRGFDFEVVRTVAFKLLRRQGGRSQK